MGIFERLGLGWFEILFHVINLIILAVALYFLLFKPVKKLVANHKKKLDDVFEQNQKLNAEAIERKHEYDRLLEDAKQEMMRAGTEATEKAQVRSEELLREAQQQADYLLESAKKEAAAEKLRMKNEVRDTVGHLAVDIAEKVLQREVSVDDNQKIIDECLREWDNA